MKGAELQAKSTRPTCGYGNGKQIQRNGAEYTGLTEKKNLRKENPIYHYPNLKMIF